jgi:hypothetical protein
LHARRQKSALRGGQQNRDWQITTASTCEAEEVIKAQTYDLLIFGQTVPDETAKRLIAIASELNPSSTSLVLCSAIGADRDLGSASYKIDFRNAGGFRTAVEKRWNPDQAQELCA